MNADIFARIGLVKNHQRIQLKVLWFVSIITNKIHCGFKCHNYGHKIYPKGKRQNLSELTKLNFSRPVESAQDPDSERLYRKRV